MINFFLSLLLFVLFFENLVVSIKYRNIHYIHMPNNAHNKNFNEKENREIYHNVNISGVNTIYEEHKNKYITLFLSNGKKILHSIFRSNNNNNNNITKCNENTGNHSNTNLKNNAENNTKNNSKNYSKGSSSCLNIQNVSNIYYDKKRIKKDTMNKKIEENFIDDENNIINDKMHCDEKEDLNEEIHVDEQNEKKSNSTLNNESFISIISNDNYEIKKDVEESYRYPNNFYLNSLEENIIYPKQPFDSGYNEKWKSHVDDILQNDSYYSSMNDNSNKSCISDYELLKTSILLNSKDDFPLYENSRRNILTTSGIINKNKNSKERKKKNLNRLFYTLKLTNNYSYKNSRSRRKYANSYNSDSSNHSGYVTDNKDYIIYHNTTTTNKKKNNNNNNNIVDNKKKYNRLYCKNSDNSNKNDYDKDINSLISDKINSEWSPKDLKYNSKIINMSNDHFNIITSDEKENIKKNAYKNYVNYINERRHGYFDLLEKKNEKIIRKLLIANNGMAALKCILSLKDWLFKKFYDENLIKIIVMATEEDIKSNCKYISLADKVIKVPGGKNINNYANVPLIVELAKSENVDAVWPGWGHSSENPLLSTLLEKENIIFIGPTGNVMEALGDKISANILAQSVEVPVVKWSGDNIRIDKFENNKINDKVYSNATIHSLDECIKECKRIGFPVMIKASQGGGGKGIRKVENENEIKKAYEQVQNELPNSPIFLMKVCNNVRHIEIQVVGDMYGNVCSLSGRDCTTQRRFQKIFEEGPPSVVSYPIFREMEKSSIRLTKMIKYRGAGTIEYLYDQINKKYFFLELNPRLQVEHPVSEGITNCNLISIQLQVAMGIPLQNIDDIRNLYQIDNIESVGKNIKNNEPKKKEFELTENLCNDNLCNDNICHIDNTSTEQNNNNSLNYYNNYRNKNVCNSYSMKSSLNYNSDENVNKMNNLLNEHFDFYNNKPNIKNHVIAARITAENSNDSFKPTSGNVRRINFQNWKDVWGYFSINDGFVHEFSDSQIGHIFAKGETREVARKNLILALRKLHIDGDIKTGTKYLAKILESKAFIDNNITTNWLDIIIEKKKHIFYNTCHIILLCATIFKLLIYFMNEKENVEENLSRDDIAIKRDKNYRNIINTNNTNSNNINNNIKHMCKMKSPYIFDMIFENIKYPFIGYNTGENLYKLEINGQEIEISAEYDKSNNKIFSTFNNQTYIYTCSEDTLGIHMQLEKDNIFIPNIRNPYHLISNTNGKIVKYLINDGEEVKKNDDYIEVEAMKMIMTFKSTETGILRHKLSEGTIIKIGDLLGIIEKGDDDKKHVNEANEIQYFKGHLDLSNKYTHELIDNRRILPNTLDDNYNKSFDNSYTFTDNMSLQNSEEHYLVEDEKRKKKKEKKKKKNLSSILNNNMVSIKTVSNDITDNINVLSAETLSEEGLKFEMRDDENVLKKNEKEEYKSHNNLKENRMDECTYEDDNCIYMKDENQKKKLYMKQNRKKIFRLFSNDNEKITSALNYINDKFHCVKNYLSNLNFYSANSLSDSNDSSYQNNNNKKNNNKINLVQQDCFNEKYSIGESSIHRNDNNLFFDKHYLKSEGKKDNVNMLNVTNKNNSMITPLTENLENNISTEIMSSRNTSNEKILHNNISKDNTITERIFNNNSSDDSNINNITLFNNISNDASTTKTNNNNNNDNINNNNNNSNNSNNINSNNNNSNNSNNNINNKGNNFKRSYYMDNTNDNIYWNHVKNEKSKYFLDIPIMKRIEFLLKGYEQDYEECFEELINHKGIKNMTNLSGYIKNINDILDTFIQYNILFSKKEFISEVDLYDILYKNIRDKKKQYEIIHAYTYNDLSIKFIEKILKYILNNINNNLPLDLILDKLKILGEFKGKIFGNIIILSRHILYLLDGLELIEYLKIPLNYNDNKNTNGTLSNDMLRLSYYMKKKNNNIDISKIMEYINNKNDIKIVNIFLKGLDNSYIHMFVPPLIKSNKNYILLKIYLNNLYKYSNIKSIWVTNNILKFSINNSEYNNLLIWNEYDTIDINKIIESDIKLNDYKYFNNVHIININNNLCAYPSQSFEDNINKILQICRNLYIYNYANNKYGDIYKWTKEDISKGLSTKYSQDGSTNNILPFEEYIFGNEKEILEYYELKNINQAIYEKTKIFLGTYKNNNISNNVNNNYTSLFGHRIIYFNDLKQKSNDDKHFEEHKYEDDKFIFNKDIHNILLELKESLNDISRARLNKMVRDNKISSYIIYHIIVDDMLDIETIKEAYKVFMIKYNEMILENYVNNIFIKIYRTNEKSCTQNGLNIELEKMFKLNVVLNKEGVKKEMSDVYNMKGDNIKKNNIKDDYNYNNNNNNNNYYYYYNDHIVEEIKEFPCFQIDTLYVKRKRAREVDTLYAYDFINLINISLNRLNKNKEKNKIFNYINNIKEFKLKNDVICSNSNSNSNSHNCKSDPLNKKDGNICLEKKGELLFEHFDNLSNYEIKIRKSLYLSDELDIGQNKRSVIGLLLNIRTDEYEEGRDVIFIINDISTQGGSFSIFEDELFYGISSYAREKKIPRIYISCNSGARIGLYNFLMDKIRIEWKDEQKKELGYKYIYITENVKEKIDKEDIIFLTEIIENNEKRYIIDGIVGNLKNPVGVENLRGSGLIAGETSKAYEEIFTLSYVTGRSVGIGAYLVRLGKRTIQKKGSSLLLTGFNALNKILGENVYVSNEQLGGVNIMMKNGISQVQVENDQEGMDIIIQWLSYIPRTSNDYYDLINNIYKENYKNIFKNNNFLITNKEKSLYKDNNLFIHNKKYENLSTPLDIKDNIKNQINTQTNVNVKDSNMIHKNRINTQSKQDQNMDEKKEKIEQIYKDQNINIINNCKTSISIHNSSSSYNFELLHINDMDYDNIDDSNIIDLIKGNQKNQGFLDKNSYFEYMNEWGKGIITGRGKLGSIPVGFIAVNKNLVTQSIPCDPALKTNAQKLIQAPCVFFPDNSFKTAQSIEDFNKENLPLFIFANWRGFSGGSMDMFYGILKFGSMIVNQLVNYKHPVFVYIPISAELRGGSWVVVDETLNSQIIEMYADVNSKGGILEPPGIVEVKFRYPDIRKLMHSIDTTIIALNEKMARCQNDEEKNNIKKDIEIKEKELLPFYLQVCHKYADLHDVSECMKAKGVIRKIVPWNKARSFFYYRLMRRLLINILRRKYENALIKNEEIENIINDLNNSEDDDYIVCNRVFNNNILRNLKNDTQDIIYNKTLKDFLKIFKMLSQEQRTEFINKINSYEN
ncbi:putative biotin carboxylase subunit of acetyl CoA carboxylase [Plasmodium gaboni]|uniref:Putative biotin carboxylase subunit of acetyl CoA carboxylase n=1 Tax=Plasmodium gaboni TaxID=647221 RepID=A0A151LBF6_9APIC|nr:putative biotin carboxylase subunit of acetyl CoA carboxylase [Plasmodium gaboni]KYN96281.1 putative biotin carboxylase subunit of acetyl CoA carboxylase [Plasmodium gaboni]